MKKSEITWTAEIPNQWGVEKIKFNFYIKSGKVLQSEQKHEFEVLTPYLTNGKVIWEKVDSKNLPKMWASPKEIRENLVNKGDLLVCEGGEGGRAAIVEEIPNPCIFQNHVHRLRPKKDLSSKYLMYILEAVKICGWFSALTKRVTLANLTSIILGNIKIPIPTNDEQNSITQFLDNKTKILDEIFFAKQKKIGLLLEKRQTLITYHITKGIKPDSVKNYSGIDWIGEIPKHWKYYKLKFVCPFITDGSHFSPTRMDEGFPMATVENMESDHINIESCYKISEVDYLSLVKSKCQPKFEDILFSKDGTIGLTFVYTQNDLIVLLSSIAIIRTNPKILNPYYCKYLLESNLMYSYLHKFKGGSALKRLILDDIKNFPMFIPDTIAEQISISEYLDKHIKKIDLDLEQTTEQIEKIQEYRDTLISYSVTGKIDLRNVLKK